MSDAMNPNPGQPENQLQTALPDDDELLKGHRNIASVIKANFEPLLGRVPAFALGPTPEADMARFDRLFRPWPKWVFRLGAELWHVDYPTIDRKVFFDTFRIIQILVFRLPVDPESYKMPVSRRDVCARIDLRVMPIITASFFGHMYEHIENERKALEAKLASGKISPEEYKKISDMNLPEKIDGTFKNLLGSWSGDEEFKPFDLIRQVENARRATFDKHGLPKETPLTPTYRLLLHNWIKIENMDGPKDVTHFLLAGKGNADFYAEYDRVKKICSRLGIRFKSGRQEYLGDIAK